MKEKEEASRRIRALAKKIRSNPEYPFRGMSTQEIVDFMRGKTRETKSQS